MSTIKFISKSRYRSERYRRTSDVARFSLIQLPLNSVHEKRDLPSLLFRKVSQPSASRIDDPLDFDGTRLHFLSLMA